MANRRIPVQFPTPGRLLNSIAEAVGVETDTALAQHMGIGSHSVRSIRSGRCAVSGYVLFKAAELTGKGPAEVLVLANMPPAALGHCWPRPVTEQFVISAAHELGLTLDEAIALFKYRRPK